MIIQRMRAERKECAWTCVRETFRDASYTCLNANIMKETMNENRTLAALAWVPFYP
jgi:hypothetical protein